MSGHAAQPAGLRKGFLLSKGGQQAKKAPGMWRRGCVRDRGTVFGPFLYGGCCTKCIGCLACRELHESNECNKFVQIKLDTQLVNLACLCVVYGLGL